MGENYEKFNFEYDTIPFHRLEMKIGDVNNINQKDEYCKYIFYFHPY